MQASSFVSSSKVVVVQTAHMSSVLLSLFDEIFFEEKSSRLAVREENALVGRYKPIEHVYRKNKAFTFQSKQLTVSNKLTHGTKEETNSNAFGATSGAIYSTDPRILECF